MREVQGRLHYLFFCGLDETILGLQHTAGIFIIVNGGGVNYDMELSLFKNRQGGFIDAL